MMLGKKADGGISQMILFISMILVASIAAGVLVQTAFKLQNTAFMTGNKAKDEISTMITTLSLYAEDGSDRDLEYWYQTVKVSPGSNGIKLDGMQLEFLWQEGSASLEYNGVNCTNASLNAPFGQGFYTDVANSNGTFGVSYLTLATNHRDGYLLSGDIALICFQSPGSLGQDKALMISMVPSLGAPMILESATPDAITRQRVFIYP